MLIPKVGWISHIGLYLFVCLYIRFNLAIIMAAFNAICVKVTQWELKNRQWVWQCPFFFHIPLANSLKVSWLILCLTRKDGSFSWMLLSADSVLVHSPRESPNYRLLAGRQTHWQPFVTNYETPSAQVWRGKEEHIQQAIPLWEIFFFLCVDTQWSSYSPIEQIQVVFEERCVRVYVRAPRSFVVIL